MAFNMTAVDFSLEREKRWDGRSKIEYRLNDFHFLT